MLNNKGISPLIVQPTLYSKSGQQLELPPVVVEANSFRNIDLSEWIRIGGDDFRQGNIRLFHTGKDLVLGAQIYLVDETNSFSFEEKLAELGKFDSRRLEGIFAIPSRQSKVKVVLTNTSSDNVTVTGRLTGESTTFNPLTVTLSPHETRILDLQKDFPGGGRALNNEAVAVSFEHNAARWAVITRAFISETSTGYSNLVQFYNPTGGLMSEYHGAGIQMRSPNGERLKPIIVLRNTSDKTANISGSVPYVRADGTNGIVSLPATVLQPNEVRLLNTSSVEQRSRKENIKFASIEIKYDTEPGSVGVAVHSESENRNFVSRVPLWDPLKQYSPTGGYPWLVEGTSETKIYIKNITDRPQKYVGFFTWENGGMYMLGLNQVAPRQTVEIDVQELRDRQTPDEEGRTIPETISRGQFQWTLRPEENVKPGDEILSGLALLGRSEQIDWGKNLSNNYACMSCCVGNTSNGYISPTSATIDVNASVAIRAYLEEETCYGFPYTYQTNASWSSSNTTIATVSGGNVTGKAVGNATVTASFSGQKYFSTPPCGPGDGPYLASCFEGSEPPEQDVLSARMKDGTDTIVMAPPCGTCYMSGTYYATRSASITVVAPPHIDEISPAGLAPGSSDVLVQILGTNFGTSPTINVSGSGVTAVYSIQTPNGFEARFTVDENAQVGQRQLTVTANGRTSNAVTFTVGDRTPIITSISRSQASTGQTFGVTIDGQHFGLNPMITFSQTGISYAINSATTTQINATFTVASNTTAGIRDIRVVSRGVTGTGFQQVPQQTDTSNTVPFQVTSPQPIISLAREWVEKNGTVDVTLSFAPGGEPVSGDTVNLKLERTAGSGSATFENGSSEVTYTATSGPQVFKIKGVTESSQVNNYKVQAEVNDSSEGQPSDDFTVVTISTLEFKRINSDITTNPGNGRPNTNVGERIFPDKTSTGDLVDRSVVSAEAKVSPMMPNLTVYLSGYDLDDPSAASGTIDPMGEGGDDNNGHVNNSRAGSFEIPTGNACSRSTATTTAPYVITVDCPTSATGVATAVFKTTMQPGDNFAIAATLSDAYRANIRTRANAGTILSNADNLVVPISGQPNVDNVPAIRTNMLTVWRKVHIEVDSMGDVADNYETGGFPSAQTINTGTTTLNLSPVNALEPNRFENGRLEARLGTTTRSFSVVNHTSPTGANTTNTVTIDNPGPPVTVSPSDSFTLYDDDDFNSDDGGSLDGDDGEDVTDPDTTLVAHESDDIASNVFAAAYVQTVHVPLTIDVTDNSIFRANILSNSADDIRTVFTGRNLPSAADTDNRYWSVYVLGAYQHTTATDLDPRIGLTFLGIADEITGITGEGSGCLIFKEIHRLVEIDPVGFEAESITTAHEIGHLFSGEHADGALMGDPLTSSQFNDTTISKIRRILHP